MENPTSTKKIKVVLIIFGFLFLLAGIVVTGELIGLKKSMAQESEGSNQNSPPGDNPANSMQASPSNVPVGQPGNPPKGSDQQNELVLPKDNKPPAFEAGGDYQYEPVGKRDPFRPYRDAKIGIGQVRAASRTPEPLERFDIKTLDVVAIVWSNDRPKALIQDPDKNIHSVVKGQRIGKNEGYVAEIREGEIVVIELYDLNGKIVKEPYVMCIDKVKGCGAI